MSGYYEMEICGLKRQLPLCPINDKLDIAGFIIFSDVELTVAACKALLAKVDEFDVILTSEAKSIPIAYEMARQSGKNYYVARKSVKLYMKNVIEASVKSITTADDQKLFIDETIVDAIKGKKVLIVDDVISTGKTLVAMEELIAAAGGVVTGKAAILAEGDSIDRKDITFIEPLPLFFK